MKILISTSTFAEYSKEPLELLKKSKINFVLNPFKRKLTKEQALELYADVDGVIAGTEAIDKDIIEKAKNLKVISRCGTGMDGLDIKYAEGKGIKIFNTADAPTNAVAELTVGLIFSLLRQIPLIDRQIRGGEWPKRMGTLLEGKTIGIIGFGRIGMKVAKLLHNFGAKIIFFDPFKKDVNHEDFKAATLHGLLRESDIVTLHMTFKEENKNLIGRKELSLMKDSSFLVNTSRGGIVDEAALFEALEDKKLSGAALDVFENEPYAGRLTALDNVVLTAHIGSYAKEARIKMETESVKNLLKGFGLSDQI